MKSLVCAIVVLLSLLQVMSGSVDRRLEPLPPVEDGIVRHPFPSRDAAMAMAESGKALESKRRISALLPGPADQLLSGMGWVWRDEEYWRRIPLAAKRIPADWSRLPVVRFVNSEIGGIREIRLNLTPDYDQWLLADRSQAMYACLSIERRTRRAYFMELSRAASGWRLQVARDHCYSCHPGGPRVIRPLWAEGVDVSTLEYFNRRLISYPPCDFGPSVNGGDRGEPLSDTRCLACHNGKNRAMLYRIHERAVRFKTEIEHSMPPAPLR